MLSKKAHFIYFYNENSKRSTEWDLMRYISVKSFAVENPDYVINFYTNKKPSGEYWERAKQYCNLIITEPDSEIFGNKLLHPAHMSDVFRIKILNQEGGVYCDFDTITLQSFTPLVEKNLFLVADLSSRKQTIGNGVIVSPPNSEYLDEWLLMFKHFRSKGLDKYWDEIGVKAHHKLMAKEKLKNTFELLTQEYFYPYSHYRTHELFSEYKLNNITKNSYSVHLYDSEKKNYVNVNSYTEDRIKQNPSESSYSWLVNKYL